MRDLKNSINKISKLKLGQWPSSAPFVVGAYTKRIYQIDNIASPALRIFCVLICREDKNQYW